MAQVAVDSEDHSADAMNIKDEPVDVSRKRKDAPVLTAPAVEQVRAVAIHRGVHNAARVALIRLHPASLYLLSLLSCPPSSASAQHSLALLSLHRDLEEGEEA